MPVINPIGPITELLRPPSSSDDRTLKKTVNVAATLARGILSEMQRIDGSSVYCSNLDDILQISEHGADLYWSNDDLELLVCVKADQQYSFYGENSKGSSIKGSYRPDAKTLLSWMESSNGKR